MLRKTLYILIILLAGQPAICQSTSLLDKGEPKTITLSYGKPGKDNFTNQVLGLISKTQATQPQQTKLEYKAVEYQKIIKNTSKLNLTLSLGNFQLIGDYNYKGFNINNFLIPTSINYTYNWAIPEGTVLEKKTFKNEKFKSGKELVKLTRSDSLAKPAYRFFLSDFSLAFDKNGFEQLDTYMSTIDGYYDADAHLNLMQQELAKVRTDTIELLKTFHQLTLNNVKAINTIKAEHYVSKLDLDTKDPIGFKSHLGKVEVTNQELKKKVEYTLDHMYETYYFKGTDWLNWHDKNKARNYFELSIANKSDYAPPHYELAQMEFENGNYTGALDTCALIIAKMRPDTDTRYSTVKLAEKIIYIHIDSVKSLVQEKKYEPAFRKLEFCESYANKIQGVKTFAEFDELYTQLYKAIYNELVTQTHLFIKEEALEKAQMNIDSLVSFRSKHEQYLISDSEERTLLKSLYAAWVKKGNGFLDQQEADSALYAFDKAYEICHTYEYVYCTDELDAQAQKARAGHYQHLLVQTQGAIQGQFADSALTLLQQADDYQKQYKLIRNSKADTLFIAAKQVKYSGLITEGDQSNQKRSYREALAYYEEAQQISQEVPIQKNPDLSGKQKESAANYIIFLCNQGMTYVEARQTPAAKTNLNTSLQLEEKYELSDNVAVSKAIEQLKNALTEGICDELDFQYQIQISAANKFIDQLDFINAVQSLDKALDLLKKNPECNHPDTIALRMKKETGAMQKYQQRRLQINELINRKSYKTAIDEYIELTKFFADSCTDNFGIAHKPIFEFIKTGTNDGLIDFAVRYYVGLKDTRSALVLLDELFNRNYDANWAKKSQVMLGVQLAFDDYNKNPAIDATQKVLTYTKNNKWYNSLRKAYLHQWKKL